MREREETWHRLERTAAHNAQGLPLPYTIGGPLTASRTDVSSKNMLKNFTISITSKLISYLIILAIQTFETFDNELENPSSGEEESGDERQEVDGQEDEHGELVRCYFN